MVFPFCVKRISAGVKAAARGIGECAFRDRRWTLAENVPGACIVNAFTVDRQPATDLAQHLLLDFGDGAISPRTHIQQQGAVLAGDIDQIGDDISGRFVIVIADIAPGILGDRCIVLPEELAHIAELTAFNIEDGDTFRIGVVLVVDRHAYSPFLAAVIVVSGEALEIRLEDDLLDPPVEPDNLRPILVHQLTAARQPIFEEFGIRARCPIFVFPFFAIGMIFGKPRPRDRTSRRLPASCTSEGKRRPPSKNHQCSAR